MQACGYMTCGVAGWYIATKHHVDQSIDDIFLIALFLFYYLKIPRVEKAAVGLGSLAWPSGHCARRFVWKTYMSLSILVHYYMCPCHYILWSICQTWSCVTIPKQLHDFEQGHESNRPTKKSVTFFFTCTCEIKFRCMLICLALCFHFTITFFIVELQKNQHTSKKM